MHGRRQCDGAQDLKIEIEKTINLSGFCNTSNVFGCKTVQIRGVVEEVLFKNSEREERRGHKYPPPHMACTYPPPHSKAVNGKKDVVKCYIYKHSTSVTYTSTQALKRFHKRPHR